MCAVSTALYLLFIDKLGRESGLNDFGSVRAREERGRESSTFRHRERASERVREGEGEGEGGREGGWGASKSCCVRMTVCVGSVR